MSFRGIGSRSIVASVAALVALAAGAGQAQAGSAPTATSAPASSITHTSATLNGSVNPNGAEVSGCEFKYGLTIFFEKSAPCSPSPGSGESPVAVSASVAGLTPGKTYYYVVVATNAFGTSESTKQSFMTLSSPTVMTSGAGGVTQTEATLKGLVNPNGEEVTACSFEYGETASYGSSVPCTPSPGAGEKSVFVSGTVAGLAVNKTYHFRLVASSAGGTGEGSDVTFKTLPKPPTVVTETPSAITPNSEMFNGTVNPNGGQVTTCKFEYGTTLSYGSSAPCASSPGSGESPVAVSASVTGLMGGVEYHVRLVAINAGGTSQGSDVTFKTLHGTQHWYKNGVLLTAGKPVPILSFGGSKDVVQLSGLGEVHCQNVGAGSIENPSGGGAGVGKALASEYYSCVAPQCEAAVKEKFGTAGRGEIRTENLPLPIGPNGSEGWEEELLTEAGSPASIRERIGLPWSAFPSGGQSGSGPTHESPPGMMRLTVICAIPSLNMVAAEAIFEGALEPEAGEAASENLDGLSAARPSLVKFPGPSGGVLHSEAAGELSSNGTVKYLGYTSQEVIAVKE
jgi:hypothetical protein